MADNEIKIKVETDLNEGLKPLLEIANKLPLGDKEKERVSQYQKQAELALNANDLKTYQKAFNNLTDYLKTFITTTGDIPEQIKKLDALKTKLSKEIDALAQKSDKISQTKLALDKQGNKVFKKEYADTFFKTEQESLGIKGKNNQLLSRDTAHQRWEYIAKILQETGKTGQNVTKELAAKAGFSSIQDAKRANQYFKTGGIENIALNRVLKEQQNLDITRQTKETEKQQVSADLEQLYQSANLSNKALSDLFKQVSDGANKINTIINQKKATKRQEEIKANKPVDANTDLNESIQKQDSSLGKAFKQFTLYAVAVRAAKSALREAVSTVKELDKYLTEQAMVTGKTRKETYALVGSYQELALQTGATTKEIASVATEYMKQGKSTKDALILTEAATKAAKVARVSVGDSVNYLTTALNGFRLSAEDAMRVSDKFAAVAASSATDYDELAIALSKVASQANLAGMSIDYTTALLTKGLETTREAPETMGTALKTIIARMREMKDYGATLEGDTDINNVESQLAYVGIALKNQQGELRSTEEVLDELGKKWDSLNKNQQAALAKALAGTRQQSRLIAMMDDYERVTELQEIAQRSAGATSAQAGTYLEGMEAAMNKIQVAGEKIVTTITDSEIIIGIFNQLAVVIDNVGTFLQNPASMIATISTIAFISLNILGTKIKEGQIARLNYKLSLRQQRLDLEQAKQQRVAELSQELATKKKINQQKILNIEKVKEKKLNGEVLTAEDQEILASEQKVLDEKTLLESEEKKLLATDTIGQKLLLQDSLLKEQESTVGHLIGGFSGIGFAIFGAVKGIKTLATSITGVLALKKQGIALSKIATMENRKEALAEAATSVAANPFGGGAIALGLLAAAGIAVAVSMAAMNGAFSHDPSEETAEDINKLSNEIYKLNEKANAIKEVDRKFSALDNKVIKTSKDMKEMNEMLESAKDKLTDEEKAQVNAFKTPQAQMKKLREIQKQAEAEANAKRKEQLDKLNALSPKERRELLTGTDSKSVEAQSAIRAIANNELYQYIDNLKETTPLLENELKATEQITQAMLDQVDATKAAELANNPQAIQDIVNSLQQVEGMELFNDDDAKLSDRVKAFQDIKVALTADEDAYNAFAQAYAEGDVFAQMSESALQFIDRTNLSIDQLNELFNGYQELQKVGIDIDQENFRTRLEQSFADIDDDFSNFNAVIKEHFGDLIATGEENTEQGNALIKSIGDQFAISTLDMGQNMEKFKNTISNFYEKSIKWNEMKDSEKAQFLSDNATFFGGEKGEELLAAFETGNFDKIEAAMQDVLGVIDAEDDVYSKREEMLDQVNRTLAIEEARKGKERNAAYIKQLHEYKTFLEDGENLFKVSLQTRLDQEKKQIDAYKEVLSKEKEALQKSLDARKDAYQKYFDTINQQKEEEDYEKETTLLITNLGKLGADSNAATASSKAELQQKLADLEEEHAEQVRQKAQEAIMENLDKEVEEINEKFDKLLDSNQALLAALKGNYKSDVPEIQEVLNSTGNITDLKLLGKMLTDAVSDGMTGNEMQAHLQELRATYANKIGTEAFDNISFKEEYGNLYLTVNGQDILLNQNDQQSVYEAIMSALHSIGQN